MTGWGALLLVVYTALGLSGMPMRKATLLAAGCTTLVLAAVLLRTGAAG
jgi:hypothetical protein